MMMRRILAAAFATTALAACVSAPVRVVPTQQVPPSARPPTAQQVPPSVALPPPAAGFVMPEIMRERGLEGVIREDSASLQRRFGAPRLATVEGDMRKLQFGGEACVLDIFLYPLAPGAEPVATWVEARRRSDGAEVDRSACVAALGRR
jgi:hypothetical protein